MRGLQGGERLGRRPPYLVLGRLDKRDLRVQLFARYLVDDGVDAGFSDDLTLRRVAHRPRSDDRAFVGVTLIRLVVERFERGEERSSGGGGRIPQVRRNRLFNPGDVALERRVDRHAVVSSIGLLLLTSEHDVAPVSEVGRYRPAERW